MPKDRGDPDQGIFQDLWTGGCKRRTGDDDLFFFFFACHPRKGVNNPWPRPVGGGPEPGGPMPWHKWHNG
jgi:hypothetical protein